MTEVTDTQKENTATAIGKGLRTPAKIVYGLGAIAAGLTVTVAGSPLLALLGVGAVCGGVQTLYSVTPQSLKNAVYAFTTGKKPEDKPAPVDTPLKKALRVYGNIGVLGSAGIITTAGFVALAFTGFGHFAAMTLGGLALTAVSGVIAARQAWRGLKTSGNNSSQTPTIAATPANEASGAAPAIAQISAEKAFTTVAEKAADHDNTTPVKAPKAAAQNKPPAA